MSCCDPPEDKYTGPECVGAEILGLGAKCNCSNAQIFLPNINRNKTINGFFGADNVVEKLKTYNQVMNKKCNPLPWTCCFGFPVVVVGIVLFTFIRGNSYTCTGATRVCGLGEDAANVTNDCNAFWCCDEWPINMQDEYVEMKEIYADQTYDFSGEPNYCQRVLGNASMMAVERDPDAWFGPDAYPSSWDITLQEGCSSGESVQGCQCTVSHTKDGPQKECSPLFMQGNPDNFSYVFLFFFFFFFYSFHFFVSLYSISILFCILGIF